MTLLLALLGSAAMASPIFTATGVMCIDSRGHCGEPGVTGWALSFTATLYECPGGICGSTDYGCVTESFGLTAHGASWECYKPDMFHPMLRYWYTLPLPFVDLSDFPESAYMTAPFSGGSFNIDAVFGVGMFGDVDHGALAGTFTIRDDGSQTVTQQSAPIHNPEPGTWVLLGIGVLALSLKRLRPPILT